MIEYEAVPIKKGSSRGIYVTGRDINEARAKLIMLASSQKGDVAYNLYGYFFQTPYLGTLVVSKTKGAFWKGSWFTTPDRDTPYRKVSENTGKLSSSTRIIPEFAKYVRRS